MLRSILLRNMLRRTLRIFACLTMWVSLVLTGAITTLAQDPKQSASVEELQALLQSIDPYRPLQPATGKLQIWGSTSMDSMAHGWATGFKQFHKDVEVVISAAGSGETFERLAKSPAGIAMFSRPVKEEELEQLRKQGLKNPTAFVVAREALGVFVHASNPAKTISGEQLRAVFTANGDSTQLTWGMFGVEGEWSKRPVNVISRTPTSGTQRFLADFVFHQATLREGKQAFDSNAEVVKAVAADPNAIAICGLKCGNTSAKPLQLTTGASLVPSDDHAVLTGHYPLTRPLTVIIDLGQTSAEARAAQEFVRYALGQAGQTQAILTGYFPVDSPLLRAELQKFEINR